MSDIIKRLTMLEKANKNLIIELNTLNDIVNKVGNLMMQQTQINAKLIQAADLSIDNIQLNAEQAEQ